MVWQGQRCDTGAMGRKGIKQHSVVKPHDQWAKVKG